MRTLLTEDFNSLIIPDKLASVDLEFEDLDVPVEQDCVEYTNVWGPMRDYGDTGEVDSTMYGTITSWCWHDYEPTEQDFARFLGVPEDEITQEMLDSIDADDFISFLLDYYAEDAAEDAAENYDPDSVDWQCESLEEAKKRKKKPYDSMSITTGDIDYNIRQFNKRMGTDFPGNDNNNPSTVEAGVTPDGGIGTACNGSSCEGLSEGVNLTEAKRYVRRYYIRPQNIFCSNKTDILKALIELDNQNCSIYTLNNLGDEKDVTKLTNKDIIYYYDDGILYDKNHVKVMDYDLYIKHEENRDNIDVNQVSDNKFSDVYDDRMTDMTKTDEVREGLKLKEARGETALLAAWNSFGKNKTFLYNYINRHIPSVFLGNCHYLKDDIKDFYINLKNILNNDKKPIIMILSQAKIGISTMAEKSMLWITPKFLPEKQRRTLAEILDIKKLELVSCIIGYGHALDSSNIIIDACYHQNISDWKNGYPGSYRSIKISIADFFKAENKKYIGSNNRDLMKLYEVYQNIFNNKAINQGTFWTKEELKSNVVSPRLMNILEAASQEMTDNEKQLTDELKNINKYLDKQIVDPENKYLQKILTEYKNILEKLKEEAKKNRYINKLDNNIISLKNKITDMENTDRKRAILQWLLDNVTACKIIAPAEEELKGWINGTPKGIDNSDDPEDLQIARQLAAENIDRRYKQIIDTYGLKNYPILSKRVSKGLDRGVQFWGISGLVTFTMSYRQMLDNTESGCPEIAELVGTAYNNRSTKGKNKIQLITDENGETYSNSNDTWNPNSLSYNYVSLAIAIIELMKATGNLDKFVDHLTNGTKVTATLPGEKQLVGVGESLEDPFDIDYKDIDLDMDNEPTNICCICGKEFAGYGNNPAPYKNTGICCDECNQKYVIPARIKQLHNHK